MDIQQKVDSAKRVIEIEINALNQLSEHLGADFSEAIDIMLATLERKSKIVVVGVGKSGNISYKIAATLNSTGSTAVVLNTQNALHGDLGLVSDGDTILALSYSGETNELIELIPFIKRFNVKMVGITGKADSSLSKYSDVTLLTPIKREACPLNLAPTSSSTAALVMGDALAMVLLEARGFTEKEFARFHPGGSLGRTLLTTVSDIMRKNEKVALLGLENTVEEAIALMSETRSGACAVAHTDGSLAGIFTHGDFARAFNDNESVRGRKVADFMTKDPITVNADSLAAEVLAKIGKHRIDDLVVLVDNKPVGLVDSQDFARLKLI